MLPTNRSSIKYIYQSDLINQSPFSLFLSLFFKDRLKDPLSICEFGRQAAAEVAEYVGWPEDPGWNLCSQHFDGKSVGEVIAIVVEHVIFTASEFFWQLSYDLAETVPHHADLP